MAIFVPSFMMVITVFLYLVVYLFILMLSASLMNAVGVLTLFPTWLLVLIAAALAAIFFPVTRSRRRRKPGGTIVPLNRIDSTYTDRYGEKAASIGRLTAAGLRTPFGFAVSNTLFDRFAERNQIAPVPPDVHPDNRRTDILKQTGDAVTKGEFGFSDSVRLFLMYIALSIRSGIDPDLIVRSSFGGEDTTGKLAPGQYRSIFTDGSFRSLLKAIKESWQSFFTERAFDYREKMGIPHTPRLSLIIQISIKAELTGTAAAANPATGFREEYVIDISGTRRNSASDETQPQETETLIINNALAFPSIPADARFPLLPALVKSIKSLARANDTAPIVEWAYRDGALYFLQIRPLAGLPDVSTLISAGMAKISPEPFCPMTLSLIKTHRDLDSFISSPLNRYLKTELQGQILRIINSRIYADFRLLDKLNVSVTITPLGFFKFVKLCFAQARETSEFIQYFGRSTEQIEKTDLSSLDARGLVELLKKLNSDMQTSGVEHQSTVGHLTGVIMTLLEKAASSIGIPVEEVRALPVYENRCIAKERETLLAGFATAIGKDRDCSGKPYDAPFSESTKSLWTEYMKKFDFLTLEDEIDLSVPRMSETPEAAFRLIASAGKGPAAAPPEAVPDIRPLVKKHRGQNIIPWDNIVLKILYKKMRTYATLREEMKYRLMKGWMLARRLLLETARREPFRDALASPDGIFFLKLDEIESAIGAGNNNIAETARRRELDFRSDAEKPAPPIIHIDDSGDILPPPAMESADEKLTLRGIAASPGAASGRARFVKDSLDSEKIAAGDIVIVEICSPWMSVMLNRAAGIISSRGGIVSHLALAAREYGTPMLVSVGAVNPDDFDGRMIVIDTAAGLARLME